MKFEILNFGAKIQSVTKILIFEKKIWEAGKFEKKISRIYFSENDDVGFVLVSRNIDLSSSFFKILRECWWSEVLCLDDLFEGMGVPGCLDSAAPSYGLTREVEQAHPHPLILLVMCLLVVERFKKCWNEKKEF